MRRGSDSTGLTHGRSNEGLKVTTSPVGGATGAFPAVRAVVAAVMNKMTSFVVATSVVNFYPEPTARTAEDETDTDKEVNPTISHP